jgi:hypothetical protein
MSFATSNVLGSVGNLGTSVIGAVPVAVQLPLNTATQTSSTITLQKGFYIINCDIAFTSNADATTTLQQLVLTNVIETGLINQSTLSFTGTGAEALSASKTINFDYSGVYYSNGDTNNAITSQLTWTGAGSVPTATTKISAYKVV